MNFNTVLDISFIIWDENDYKINKSHYYKLANSISMLFEKLQNEKPKILLRNELLDEMINGFPCTLLPDCFYEFKQVVYSFLGHVGSNIITYPAETIPNIFSIPNLIKAHFNKITQNEVNYLISKIHSDTDSENVFFTFQYLWNEKNKLKTEANENIKEYETIISDNENDLNAFFTQFTLIFEHNRKHDKTLYNTKEKCEETKDKEKFISRLSCYNGKDNILPQTLLDTAIKYESLFYNYDSENNVFVIFRNTEKNIYHGYDENDPNKIPDEVRNKLNK